MLVGGREWVRLRLCLCVCVCVCVNLSLSLSLALALALALSLSLSLSRWCTRELKGREVLQTKKNKKKNQGEKK